MRSSFVTLTAVAALCCSIAGCGNPDKGPTQKAGEAIDGAAAKTSEALEKAATKTGEVVDKTVEAVKDAGK